jgi:hypothetical protein
MKLGFFRLGFLVLGSTSLGCANDEEEFQYSRADMEAAVFGTWTGTFTQDGTTAVPLTLEIREYVDGVRPPACAQRNFSDGSGTPGLDVRCSASSTLNLTATLVVEDAGLVAEFYGDFTVGGLTLTGGDLSLYDASATPSTLDGRLYATLVGDTWESCRYGGEKILGDCTLDARIEE